MQSQLCLACSSSIPASVKPSSIFVHGCCSRSICANCLQQNPRLATFCPICEDATAAFRKGPRPEVTRAGQVVFDADAALRAEQVAPPSYLEAVAQGEKGQDAGDKKSAFVVDDDDDGSDDGELEAERKASKSLQKQEKSRQQSRPSLLARQASKSSAGAEVDVAPQNGESSNAHVEPDVNNGSALSLNSHRHKVDPHHTSSTLDAVSGPSSSRPGDGQTRQYWLRKTDTLQSIAIRFAVSTNELCLLNSLPRAVLSTSPHLLHTRPFILIPAHAVEKQLAANPGLMQSLEGPPRKSAKEKTTAARRTAEAKFRATLAKVAATNGGETPADEKAAKAYIGLAEDEFRLVDFGEGTDADGLPQRYDVDLEERKGMLDAQMDTARRLRFDAILKHALAKWEMDSDWERSQRANGLDPSAISQPLPASTTTSSIMDKKEKRTSTDNRRSNVGSWFSRALNTDRGEQQPSSSPSSPSSSRPRHVIALSSSVRLPTHLSQTFPTAHKGPINVARYNSLGRYLLTGGSDRAIRLWNAKSGEAEPIKTYTEHVHEVLALDISRDNSRFVSGGADKSVYVWDVATGGVVRRFGGHFGKVNDVRFGGKDGDGSVVVVGGFDGVVRIFDLRAQGAWRPIMELKEAKDAVTSLAVREDSMLSGSVDGVLRCYDLRSGQLRSDVLPAPITSVASSRLGTSVLVATLDSTVRLLDTRDGTLLQSYSGHKHESYRCKAVFAAEEDGVVAGDEQGNLVGWDTVSAERVAVGGSAAAKPILWVESNPDASSGQEIVAASADGVVNVWSMSS